MTAPEIVLRVLRQVPQSESAYAVMNLGFEAGSSWNVYGSWYPRSVTEFSPGKVLYQHVSIYLHAGMFVCLFVYLFVRGL
jgi:hypothetical protein